MLQEEMQARLAELFAEVDQLKVFIAAVERGEHDDEDRIASAVAKLVPPEPEPKRLFRRREQAPADDRADLIRTVQRGSLAKQAYDRINNELFPEIHELRFRLAQLSE